MTMLFALLAGLAIGFLGWQLYRRFGSDRISSLIESRRTTSRLVGRGEFVDGNRHLAVALAVTAESLFYENSDMHASIDLQFIEEIEYDTQLATGTDVSGARVLRLRSQSQTFEFVLPAEFASRWFLILPPRRSALWRTPEAAF